jgi:methyl-accepting chemotaxis protein
VEQNITRIADLIGGIRDAVGEGTGRAENLASMAAELSGSVGEFRLA